MASKLVTYAELKEHSTKESLYILLHEKVYDVTKFIDEHPGGDEVIIAEAGRDSTEAFEDVGHSDEARALLKDLLVGDFEKTDELKTKGPSASSSSHGGAVNSAVEQGSKYVAHVAEARSILTNLSQRDVLRPPRGAGCLLRVALLLQRLDMSSGLPLWFASSYPALHILSVFLCCD
ncbi:hypothetical protein VTO73DRAFT_12915 [Trametes versicolor]